MHLFLIYFKPGELLESIKLNAYLIYASKAWLLKTDTAHQSYYQCIITELLGPTPFPTQTPFLQDVELVLYGTVF